MRLLASMSLCFSSMPACANWRAFDTLICRERSRLRLPEERVGRIGASARQPAASPMPAPASLGLHRSVEPSARVPGVLVTWASATAFQGCVDLVLLRALARGVANLKAG